jgi:predicted ATPase
MLTRLKVSGFKNLVDVDVRFGPFTCVAGPNGAGKSNLFDAIRFLSALADRSLIEAALSVRDEGGRTADVRDLFHRVEDQYDHRMAFTAEMIVPGEGVDERRQKAKASITFLRYSVTIGHRTGDGLAPGGTLELIEEDLTHITLGDAPNHLLFPHSARWRNSVVWGRRTSPFISTEGCDAARVIRLHQEGRQGRTRSFLATDLPRTVLSTVNAAESATAVLARREMQSWRLLQLEPSSLRQPDEFTAPPRLAADGSHLASTLYRLARSRRDDEANGDGASQVYGQVANRLAELVDEVREVWVDRDEKRELLTLQVVDRTRTAFPARSLSDGTLRFLALAVLDLDPEAQGLLCLEEPENGIHPERIPAMLRLLQDIGADVDQPAGSDNPLRQVIVNTHSPAVVGQVPDDGVLVAELKEMVRSGQRFRCASFGCLPDTWRESAPEQVPIVPRGRLLAYLNPLATAEPLQSEQDLRPESVVLTDRRAKLHGLGRRRVIDRPDLQPLLPFTRTPA